MPNWRAFTLFATVAVGAIAFSASALAFGHGGGGHNGGGFRASGGGPHSLAGHAFAGHAFAGHSFTGLRPPATLWLMNPTRPHFAVARWTVVNLTTPTCWWATIIWRTMSSLVRNFAASTVSMTLAVTETFSAADAPGTDGAAAFGAQDGIAGDAVSAAGPDPCFGHFFTVTFSRSPYGRTIITIRSGRSGQISCSGAYTRQVLLRRIREQPQSQEQLGGRQPGDPG